MTLRIRYQPITIAPLPAWSERAQTSIAQLGYAHSTRTRME